MPLGMSMVSNIFSLILMETTLSVDIIMDKDVLCIRPRNSVGFNLPFGSEKKVNILTFSCQVSTDWGKKREIRN